MFKEDELQMIELWGFINIIRGIFRSKMGILRRIIK